MGFIVSVLRLDLARQSRSIWPRLYRLSFAMLPALLLLLLSAHARSGAAVGLELLRVILPTVLVLACFVPGLLAALEIRREQTSRARELMALTDHGRGALLLARYASVISQMLLALLSALPIILLCVSLGGVSTGQVLTALLLLVAVVCLSIGLGTIAGAHANSHGGALAWAIAFNSAAFGHAPATGWKTASPRQQLLHVLDYGLLRECLLLSLGFLVLALVALLIARWLLPGSSSVVGTAPVAPSHRPRPAIGDLPPVYWHQLYCRLQSHRPPLTPTWQRLLVWTLLAIDTLIVWRLGVGLSYLDISWPRWLFQALPILYMITVALCITYVLWGMYQSALAFEGEHESQVLELIRCTALDGRELVDGKLRAIRDNLRPFAVGTAVFLFLTIWSRLLISMRSPFSGEGDDFILLALLCFAGLGGIASGTRSACLHAGYRHPGAPLVHAAILAPIIAIAGFSISVPCGLFLVIVSSNVFGLIDFSSDLSSWLPNERALVLYAAVFASSFVGNFLMAATREATTTHLNETA